MSPRQLLGAARELMTKPSPGTVGLWPRAAAVLARQALENQMTIILTRWIPGVESANARTKLICLQARMQDRELAERANHAWWALTTACHHRSYELPPTAEELERWLGAVEELVSSGAGAGA